jgi:hypothetical protein
MPMEHEDYISAESLLCLTAWASRALIADLNHRFRQAGLRLTMEQWRRPACPAERDGLTQNDLAGLLLQEKTSVSRVLTGMQRRGYVARKPHARTAAATGCWSPNRGWRPAAWGASWPPTPCGWPARGWPGRIWRPGQRVLARIVRNVRGENQVLEQPEDAVHRTLSPGRTRARHEKNPAGGAPAGACVSAADRRRAILPFSCARR